MIHSIAFAASLSSIVQSAAIDPAQPVDQESITSLSQLPVEEAAAPRCGVVFAIVDVAQKAGNTKAKQWPDMASTNGREFFVRSVAKLMEDRGLTREQVDAMLVREAQLLQDDDLSRASELMPPCLLMKRAAGL